MTEIKLLDNEALNPIETRLKDWPKERNGYPCSWIEATQMLATIRSLQAANAALYRDTGQQLQQAHGAVRRYQDEDERLKSRILSAIKDKAEGWDSEADKARSIGTRRGALYKRDAAREIIKLVKGLK